MRGLKLKIISKQDATLKMVAKLLSEGHDPDVSVQPSIDPYWIPITEDDLAGAGAEHYGSAIKRAQGRGDQATAQAMTEEAAALYKAWGRETKVIDGMLYRKYGFSYDQVHRLVDEYPQLKGRVQPRLVIGHPKEAVWAALNHPEAVVTWMHARIRAGMFSDVVGQQMGLGDIGNFPGRVIFQSPQESGNGRWRMLLQNERQKGKEGEISETDACKSVNDYIYANHATQADQIYQTLKRSSCCQGGASDDACMDCAAHCAMGPSNNEYLIDAGLVEQSAREVGQQQAGQRAVQSQNAPRPQLTESQRLANLGRAMSRSRFSMLDQAMRAYYGASSEPAVDAFWQGQPGTITVIEENRPIRYSRRHGSVCVERLGVGQSSDLD